MELIGDFLGGLPPLLVYCVVAAVVIAEAAFVAGLVLPAATSLVALGLLANAGTVNPVVALGVAVVSAGLGGTLGYLLGRRGGRQSTRSGRWDRAGRLFDRHGGRAVFLGVWVAGTRTLIPRLAGMRAMPYARFARWHLPAAGLWAAWLVGASYLAGASFDRLAARIGHAGGAVTALALLVAALILAGRWFARHPGPVHALGALVRRVPRPGRHRLLADAALSAGLLILAAAVLVAVVPALVRFSGLRAADGAIAEWARADRTPASRQAAWQIVDATNPGVLLLTAAAVLLVQWWWTSHGDRLAGLLRAAGPVLPPAVFGQLFDTLFANTDELRTAISDGVRPDRDEIAEAAGTAGAADTLAVLVRGETAEFAAAAGLLVWLVARRLPWRWRVTAWTVAAAWVALYAGAWIHLGIGAASGTVAAVVIGAVWAVLNAAVWTPAAVVVEKSAPVVEESPLH